MNRLCFTISIILSINAYSQTIKPDLNRLEAANVFISKEKLMGREAVKVIKDSSVKEVDEPTFFKTVGVNFKNGTIEIKVLSKLLNTAPEFARGFIGIAFRINDSNTKYESIYIRPTNARSGDQVRRNHTIQYYSYPDYKFDRLRKESPERYESYADMELNKWIDLRIEVKDKQARLFINKSQQPALVVTDLKHGENIAGDIGLWVDIGTEGFFKDLTIRKE